MSSLEQSRNTVNALLRSPKGARISLLEQEDLSLGLDLYQQIFSLCTSNILMIDFDFKLGYDQYNVFDSLIELNMNHRNK